MLLLEKAALVTELKLPVPVEVAVGPFADSLNVVVESLLKPELDDVLVEVEEIEALAVPPPAIVSSCISVRPVLAIAEPMTPPQIAMINNVELTNIFLISMMFPL